VALWSACLETGPQSAREPRPDHQVPQPPKGPAQGVRIAPARQRPVHFHCLPHRPHRMIRATTQRPIALCLCRRSAQRLPGLSTVFFTRIAGHEAGRQYRFHVRQAQALRQRGSDSASALNYATYSVRRPCGSPAHHQHWYHPAGGAKDRFAQVCPFQRVSRAGNKMNPTSGFTFPFIPDGASIRTPAKLPWDQTTPCRPRGISPDRPPVSCASP